MIDIKNCFTYAYSAGTFADFYQNVAADAESTNVIDLWAQTSLQTGEAGLRITGKNGPYLIVKTFAVNPDTGISLNIQLCSSTSTTVSSAYIIAQYRFLTANMAASATTGALLINQQLPIGKYYRYLGIYFNVFTSFGAATLYLCAYLSDAPERAEQVLGQVVPAT